MATSTIKAPTYYRYAFCYSPIIPTGETNEIVGLAVASGLENGVWRCSMAYELRSNNSLWAIGPSFVVTDHQCKERLTLTDANAYYLVNTLRGGLLHARLALVWVRAE